MKMIVVQGEWGGYLIFTVVPGSPGVVRVDVCHEATDEPLDTCFVPVSFLVELGVNLGKEG